MSGVTCVSGVTFDHYKKTFCCSTGMQRYGTTTCSRTDHVLESYSNETRNKERMEQLVAMDIRTLKILS